MKKILSLMLILPSLAFSQVKMDLNENITGSRNSGVSGQQTRIIANLSNRFEFSKYYADINPYYNLGCTGTKFTASEFLTREDVGLHYEDKSAFLVHQYNTSLIRSIDYDNWCGIGFGRKFELNKKVSLSLSYCYEYEFRKYYSVLSERVQRYSFRGKLKIYLRNISISSEYYFQPAINNSSDVNVFGTTTLSFFTNKPVNFIVQNVYNYMSTDNVKVVQTTTFGINIKITNKNEKSNSSN